MAALIGSRKSSEVLALFVIWRYQARHWPVRSWFLFALFCSVSVRGSFSKKTDQRQNLSNPELLVIFFMFV
jgi:hypothetical protein